MGTTDVPLSVGPVNCVKEPPDTTTPDPFVGTDSLSHVLSLKNISPPIAVPFDVAIACDVVAASGSSEV